MPALSSDNGDELTLEESAAILALARLAKTWPPTLTLVSMDSGLCVIHTGDPRFHDLLSQVRTSAVVYQFDGIPNDGGGW